MKNKDEKTATDSSSSRSATPAAVEEAPAAGQGKKFRLARKGLDRELAEQLVAQARDDGVDLVGPDGLLSGIVGQVLETALEVEMTKHLGYERHERSDSSNSRNGTSPKTVQTDVGPSRSRCPGIGPAGSSRRSCRSTPGACQASMTR